MLAIIWLIIVENVGLGRGMAELGTYYLAGLAPLFNRLI